MLQQLQTHSVRIVTGVSFFLFGFFVVANTLDLSDRDIVVGLIAGVIGGLTMLVTVLHEGRAASARAQAQRHEFSARIERQRNPATPNMPSISTRAP
jgi:hypothetical protein